MSKTAPKISIIIPCRNEEKFIGKCLDSLVAQGFPADRLEILVVNGASEDKTEEVIRSYVQKYPFVKLLQSPQKCTPISMNVGLKNATGDVVMIVGAHSDLEPGYVRKCVQYLYQYDADAVGGILITKPATQTLAAKAIVAVLTSFFGTGGSRFRMKRGGGIQESDTVFNGCYRREVFEKIGYFNEKLFGSQDFELNLRLKKAGGKILLAPNIATAYYPKATLKEFFKHNIKDGIWAILPMKYGAPPFKLRHLIPLFFVLGVIGPFILSIWYRPFIFLTLGVLGLYLLASFYFSIRIAVKEKNLLLIPFLVAAFAVRHFGYGFGSFIGLFRLITG